jgi:hypothetical protein
MLPNKKIFSIFILSFLPLFSLLAEFSRNYNIEGWGQDPFISGLDMQKKESGKEDTHQEKEDSLIKAKQQLKQKIYKEVCELNLSGILKGKNKLVIIDGEIYAEGNIVKGKQIVEIGQENVILEQEGFKFSLELSDNNYEEDSN